jgi:hypothetical protein
MATVHSLLSAIDETTIARKVGIPHDETRMQYPLESNTVATFERFGAIIGDYYNYHYTRCISNGGRLTRDQAYGAARTLLERDYRRQRGDIVSAFNDAHDGTSGGMRLILDKIADGLKAEATEAYITAVFDRHVSPSSWDQKVDMIRQFIAWCGNILPSSVDRNRPERYAHDYAVLIRAYVQGLQQTSAIFRRL